MAVFRQLDCEVALAVPARLIGYPASCGTDASNAHLIQTALNLYFGEYLTAKSYREESNYPKLRPKIRFYRRQKHNRREHSLH